MNLTIPEEFPISEKERQLIKKKILLFLAWCNDGHACYENEKECPFLAYDESPSPRDCFGLFIHWIMEAEI